jgi:hypothetical protein
MLLDFQHAAWPAWHAHCAWQTFVKWLAVQQNALPCMPGSSADDEMATRGWLAHRSRLPCVGPANRWGHMGSAVMDPFKPKHHRPSWDCEASRLGWSAAQESGLCASCVSGRIVVHAAPYPPHPTPPPHTHRHTPPRRWGSRRRRGKLPPLRPRPPACLSAPAPLRAAQPPPPPASSATCCRVAGGTCATPE